jgi:hypothetical protein
LLDYIGDEQYVSKISDSELSSLPSNNYHLNGNFTKYNLGIDCGNLKIFLFKNKDEKIILSIYDTERYDDKTTFITKLNLFYYMCHKIFIKSSLYKSYFKPDNISFHFTLDIDDVKIRTISLNDRVLTGEELLLYSIESLFLTDDLGATIENIKI